MLEQLRQEDSSVTGAPLLHQSRAVRLTDSLNEELLTSQKTTEGRMMGQKSAALLAKRSSSSYRLNSLS